MPGEQIRQRGEASIRKGGFPGAVAGSALVVAMSEPGNSDYRWQVRVDAESQEGRFIVGTFRTIPPSLSGTASRVLAFAQHPGAINWHVVVTVVERLGTGNLKDASCRLFLNTQECCPGFAGGIQLVNAEGPADYLFEVVTTGISLLAATTTLLVPRNPNRKRLIIQNASVGAMILGTSPTVVGNWLLGGEIAGPPVRFDSLETTFQGAIYGRMAAGTGVAQMWEERA